MVTYNRTVTLPIPAASWSAASTYAANARVSLGGHVYESTQANNANHQPPNGTWWTDLGLSFDPTGTTDISDQLIAWLISGRGGPGPLNVPDGPSTYVHTRVYFPPTQLNGQRAIYRVEGSVAGELNLISFVNVTFDGGGAPGGPRAGNNTGAKFISTIPHVFVARCSNPAGQTRVDGVTSKSNNTLSVATPIFIPGMVGAQITLDANRRVNVIAGSWSAANGGTHTFTCGTIANNGTKTAIPCPFAPGARLDSIDGCNPSAYNSGPVLVAATAQNNGSLNANQFTIINQGADPGPLVPPASPTTSGSVLITETTTPRHVTSVAGDGRSLVYDGAPYGEWGSETPTPKYIRWATLPNIAAKNYVTGTIYNTDQKAASGGKLYKSLTDNNNTAPPGANWTSLGNITNNIGPDNADYSTAAGLRGEWDIVYFPTGATAIYGYTGSNANGSAQTQASTRAGNASGGRQFFQLIRCARVRFINMHFQGSFGGGGGAALSADETQNAFMIKGCDDIEIGNCTIEDQYGNGLEIFPDENDRATIGLWVHDCLFHGFGRQTMSFQFGGTVYVERNQLGGAGHTIIDIEPVTSFSRHDPRLTNVVDGIFLFYNDITHHGLGGIISLHQDCSNVHIKGNTGVTIGSGSTWQADTIIYEDNHETSGGQGSPRIVTVRTPKGPGYPASGGYNIWVKNNVFQQANLICNFANPNNALVHSEHAGQSTAAFTGTQNLRITVDGFTSIYPDAGILYVGDPWNPDDLANHTYFTYNGYDDTHFHNVQGHGPARTLATNTPLRGLNGCLNYRSTGNTSELNPNVTQYEDRADYPWDRFGTPFVPFTIGPNPHAFRDEPTSGPNPSTITTSGIAPHQFTQTPVLLVSGVTTTTSRWLLEDGSVALLEDGTSFELLEDNGIAPPTETTSFQTEDSAILFAEDGTPLLIEADIPGPVIQPAGRTSTLVFGTTSLSEVPSITIVATGRASTITFGNPALNGVGIGNIFPAGRPSTITFGRPTVTTPGSAFPLTIRPLGFRVGPLVTVAAEADLDANFDLDSPVDLDVGGTTTQTVEIQFGVPTLLGIRTPIKIALPSTDDILNGLLPVRTDDFEFELIDLAGIHLGYLDVAKDVTATMRMDTSRTTFRTLSGIEVFRADMSQIDVEHERLKVTMILQNGARFPLGVLMFGQDNRAPASWGNKLTPECFDEVFLIDQDLDTTVTAPIGASVYDLITVLLAPFKYEILIDLPDVSVAAPLVFQVGSSRYAALVQAATLLGCFAPHFDNEHRFHFKSAQLSGDTTVDHTYSKGLRIIEEQTQISSSSYKAPNKYIVSSGDPVNPVVGVYNLPPSAPHSAFSRDGRIVTKSRTAQGLLTNEAAQQAAYVDAITDRTAYGRINFAATADPRHDSFDTMEVLGLRYLETAWTLELVSGGLHTHEGTTLWAP